MGGARGAKYWERHTGIAEIYEQRFRDDLRTIMGYYNQSEASE